MSVQMRPEDEEGEEESEKPRIYLAGPLHNFDNQDWREDVKRDYPQYEFIDPLDWSDRDVVTDDTGFPKNPEDIPAVRIRRKCEDDLERSDALFAFLPDDVQSRGTDMEIRAAAAEYKIPVGICSTVPDMRSLSDMLVAHADVISYDFQSALMLLEEEL